MNAVKQEVLAEAIEKAVMNGWDQYSTKCCKWSNPTRLRYYDIIYNHEFAKAIWGDRQDYYSPAGDYNPGWQYHLQQMVIADDPLEYLGAHLA